MKEIELHELELQFFNLMEIGQYLIRSPCLKQSLTAGHWNCFDETNGDPPYGASPQTTFLKVVLRREWRAEQGQGLLGRYKGKWPLGSQVTGPTSLRKELQYYELDLGKTH